MCPAFCSRINDSTALVMVTVPNRFAPWRRPHRLDLTGSVRRLTVAKTMLMINSIMKKSWPAAPSVMRARLSAFDTDAATEVIE
jgi:hypothetical protein